MAGDAAVPTSHITTVGPSALGARFRSRLPGRSSRLRSVDHAAGGQKRRSARPVGHIRLSEARRGRSPQSCQAFGARGLSNGAARPAWRHRLGGHPTPRHRPGRDAIARFLAGLGLPTAPTFAGTLIGWCEPGRVLHPLRQQNSRILNTALPMRLPRRPSGWTSASISLVQLLRLSASRWARWAFEMRKKKAPGASRALPVLSGGERSQTAMVPRMDRVRDYIPRTAEVSATGANKFRPQSHCMQKSC